MSKTLSFFRGHERRFVFADNWNILKPILWCDKYIFVSGGLIKDCAEKRFMFRKLLAVLLARLFHKKIEIGTQTIFLHGFYRALFKLIFYGLIVKTRDYYSFVDVKNLGLDSVMREDLLIGEKHLLKDNYIAIDMRLFNLGLKNKIPKRNKFSLVVETNNSFMSSKQTEILFGCADIVYSGSFHGCIFGLNGGAKVYFIPDKIYGEYELRKISALRNVVVLDS